MQSRGNHREGADDPSGEPLRDDSGRAHEYPADRARGHDQARADAAVSPAVLTREVLGMAKALGFALAGVAPAAPSEYQAQLRAWLLAGKHGEMEYLAEDLDIRLDPRTLAPWIKCFVAVADLYATRNEEPAIDADGAPAGKIARYARGKDYHEVLRKHKLHALADALRAKYPGSKFRTCVDTVPVMEREIAGNAGLGWQGKNTMLIHPRVGSYFVLGVVATNLELVAMQEHERVADSCGSCTRCIDACPTGAITPYSVDGSRCISYLTIERRGEIPDGLHDAMGSWVFGCDVCQEVCPHNSAREGGVDVGSAHGAYAARRSGFDLLELLDWTPAERRSALSHSAMKRATLAMMKRNALIALGNHVRALEKSAREGGATRAGALRARIVLAAQDLAEPELVRATAARVLARLG